MSSCDHNCSSCGQNCGERDKESLLAPAHPQSNVKKIIAVVSGNGGVGKSLVTTLLATQMNKDGFKTAILDADITGPSIPTAFGVTERISGNDMGMLPAVSKKGISMMSVNLLLERATDPIIWRGVIIANTVKQFWSDTAWGDVDYMFVDMPPGTGDVPLTVFQSLPISGIIVVTSPQELVSMIVEKAVNMADMMNIPILALVENMSYFECGGCGKRHKIFGDSHIEEIAKKHGIKHIFQIPINPEIAKAVDSGTIEDFENDYFKDAKTLL